MASDRIKILSLSCVYPNPADSSAGLFVRERLQSLAALVQVKVIAPVPAIDYKRLWASDRHQPIDRRRIDGSVEVIHPRWLYPPGGSFLNPFFLFLRLFWPVLRLCAGSGVDLIDSHFGYPDGIAAGLLATALRRPFIVTLRGSELLHGLSSSKRKLMAWSFRRAAHVVALSDELARFAVELGAAPSRVSTIPNGVDGAVFFPRDRLRARMKHELPPDRKVILSAGHLIALKGHHYAIEALSNLRREGVDACLLIAGGAGRGGPNLEGELRRLASDLGVGDSVRFLGPVDRNVLAELMAAADVFCLASTREGCPNVVNEALACGTPVVATRVGAVPSLIPSERYGVIARAQDAEALHQALRQALENTWDREAIAAWGQSRSWRHVALEVLARICQAIPPARSTAS